VAFSRLMAGSSETQVLRTADAYWRKAA